MFQAAAKLRRIAAAASALAAAGWPAHAAEASPTGISGWIFPAASSRLQASFYETIHSADPVKSWFFSNQYTAGGHTAYVGLQPRPGATDPAKLQVLGIYSVFGAGASSTDPRCVSGADGGSGVSCSASFEITLGHAYELRTESKDGGQTWEGTAVDSVTKTAAHLGSWKTDTPSGVMYNGTTWIEHIPAVAPRTPDQCKTNMPAFDITFGAPTANDGGQKASFPKLTEGSPCVGLQNFTKAPDGDGWQITVSKAG